MTEILRKPMEVDAGDIAARQRAEVRIARLSRAQAILSGMSHAIVHVSDRQKLLDEVCRVAVENGGFKLAWIGMVAPDKSVQPVAKAGATKYLTGIRVVTSDEPEGRGPVGTAIREDHPVIIENIDHDPRMAPWRARLRRFGLHYMAAFPLRIAGKAVGAFQVYAPDAGFFDDNELGLLTQVSGDISFALTAMAEHATRKVVDEALHRSERNLSIFFNQAPIGLIWLAADGTILRANQAQLDLLGYAAAEYLGHSFTEFCGDPAQGHDLLKRLAAKETIRNLPMTRRRRDGTLLHVLVDAGSFWNGNKFQYSSIFLRDVSDRIKLEGEVLQAGEREQLRIAQDLHDGLGQLLVASAYLTSNLRQDLAAQSLPEAQEARRILEVINDAIAQTRNLARGMSPVESEPNGLMVALAALAEQTKKIFHVQCQFHCRRAVLIPDNIVATHLFRIAQEAITNAIKHGKSSRIQIWLAKLPGEITLAINDNGKGLPVRPQKKTGMGLRVMRHRAEMIGGILAIQKNPGGGTAILCTVPLSNQARSPQRPKTTLGEREMTW